MPFTFKLSQRLARLRVAAVVLTVAAVACIAGDQSVSGPTQLSSRRSSPGITADAVATTVLLQDDFEDSGFGTRGWYDFRSTPTLTDTTHAPGSTQSLEAHFTTGATTPPWVAARRLFTPSPTVYVSYWVRYSANWVGSGQPYHPHEFEIMSDLDGDYDGPSNSWMAAYIEHNYQNGGMPRLSIQDSKAINTTRGTPPINLIGVTEDRSIGGCNGVAEANVVVSCFSFPPWYNDKEMTAPQVWFKPTPGTGYKGNWNHVEAYLKINSIVNGIGQADGVAQYWFNGTLVIDRHDVFFRTGARPNINFHQFVMAPYIGDGSPVDQYMWIDNLVVAAGPPGTAPAAPVALVSVAPATASVVAGQTVQLAATLTDSSGSALTGRAVTWATSNAAVATVSASGLVTGVAAGGGAATITATSEGVSSTAAVTVTAPTSTQPAAVTDLAVASTTTTSVTLSFSEVNDGTGQPATYDVRYAAGTLSWGGAGSVTQGTCATPVTGSAIGTARTCTVLGLTAATAYQFELVAFRGTMNQNAVYGPLSNVASGTTAAAQAPVASVTLAPASASVVVGRTVQAVATLKDASGAVLTGRSIAWTTSNAAAATVSASGLVTGVAAGAATITATSEGVSGIVAVTVTTTTAKPGRVTTLAVASVTTSSVTLTFKEVGDGTGQPANYDVRYAAGPMSWGAAPSVTQGTCSTPLVGTAKGTLRSCTVLGLAAGTAYQFQLVAYRGTLNVTGVVFGALSNVASGTTAPASANPGAVTDLAVAGVTESSVTLSFTEVNDGTGLPAQYDVRDAAGTISWGAAPAVSNGTCTTPVTGSAIGARRTCTVLGLTAATAYQFQLVSFRGTLNQSDIVFGPLSNITGGTTSGGSVPPPPPPPPPPPSGGAWPNEPAGMTLLTDEPFNALTESGWNAVQRQTTNGSGLSISTDATAPVSPANVLTYKYAAGYSAGSEPGAEFFAPGTPVRETFMGFWWKVSNPWQFHPSGVNKITFLFTAVDNIYLMMYDDGAGPTIQVEPQLLNDVRRLAPNVTATRVTLGVWHRIEWYVKQSTTGTSADGVVKWWLDGVLQGEYTDLQMSVNPGFIEYTIAPTWGGIGGTKSETDFYWYDQFHISRR